MPTLHYQLTFQFDDYQKNEKAILTLLNAYQDKGMLISFKAVNVAEHLTALKQLNKQRLQIDDQLSVISYSKKRQNSIFEQLVGTLFHHAHDDMAIEVNDSHAEYTQTKEVCKRAGYKHLRKLNESQVTITFLHEQLTRVDLLLLPKLKAICPVQMHPRMATNETELSSAFKSDIHRSFR